MPRLWLILLDDQRRDGHERRKYNTSDDCFTRETEWGKRQTEGIEETGKSLEDPTEKKKMKKTQKSHLTKKRKKNKRIKRTVQKELKTPKYAVETAQDEQI